MKNKLPELINRISKVKEKNMSHEHVLKFGQRFFSKPMNQK